MPAAAIGAGGAVVSGLIGSSASKKASNAQTAADQAAIAEQRRQYDQTRADFAPYRSVGTGALDQLAALYGIPQGQQQMPSNLSSYDAWLTDRVGNRTVYNPSAYPALTRDAYDSAVSQWRGANPGQAAPAPDYSTFTNSPDYKFNMQEGLRAVEGGAAARGGLYSGATMRALQERGAGIASQQYGNYTNRLAALAGVGQSATNSMAGYGSQASGNIGNLISAQGDARASGIANNANVWGNTLGDVAAYGYDWYTNRKK